MKSVLLLAVTLFSFATTQNADASMIYVKQWKCTDTNGQLMAFDGDVSAEELLKNLKIYDKDFEKDGTPENPNFKIVDQKIFDVKAGDKGNQSVKIVILSLSVEFKLLRINQVMFNTPALMTCTKEN